MFGFYTFSTHQLPLRWKKKKNRTYSNNSRKYSLLFSPTKKKKMIKYTGFFGKYVFCQKQMHVYESFNNFNFFNFIKRLINNRPVKPCVMTFLRPRTTVHDGRTPNTPWTRFLSVVSTSRQGISSNEGNTRTNRIFCEFVFSDRKLSEIFDAEIRAKWRNYRAFTHKNRNGVTGNDGCFVAYFH